MPYGYGSAALNYASHNSLYECFHYAFIWEPLVDLSITLKALCLMHLPVFSGAD